MVFCLRTSLLCQVIVDNVSFKSHYLLPHHIHIVYEKIEFMDNAEIIIMLCHIRNRIG